MVRSLGAIYKAVAQSLLLYGIKSLLVTGGGSQGPGGVPSPGGATDHGDDG